MSVRETIGRFRDMDLELPRDARRIETLLATGMVISGIALSDLVDRRFRFLAFGACGLLAAGAFGFSPLSRLMNARGEEESGSNEESWDESEEIVPAKVGVPPIASLGVPHRIPEEVVMARTTRRQATDERPAPSADGERDLSD